MQSLETRRSLPCARRFASSQTLPSPTSPWASALAASGKKGEADAEFAEAKRLNPELDPPP